MWKQGRIHCRKYKCKLWEIQLENGLTNMKPSLAANTTLNWKKSCWKRCSKKVDKLEAQRNVLQLRPEMTCASWDSVQGLYTWCRSQWCVSCGGVQSIFSVLDASEVKLPALRAFVLPTDIHVSWGTWLGAYMQKRTFVAETAIWAKKICGKFGLKMA